MSYLQFITSSVILNLIKFAILVTTLSLQLLPSYVFFTPVDSLFGEPL